MIGHLELLLSEVQSNYCKQEVKGDGAPFEAWKLGAGVRWEQKQPTRVFSAVCQSIVRAFFVPTSTHLSMLRYAVRRRTSMSLFISCSSSETMSTF
jgi:hypothetical protein